MLRLCLAYCICMIISWQFCLCLLILGFNLAKRGSQSHYSLLIGKVKGMEVGLTVGLENHEGTLKLSLMNSGCHVRDISIKLDGGAAWLYQGYAMVAACRSLTFAALSPLSEFSCCCCSYHELASSSFSSFAANSQIDSIV